MSRRVALRGATIATALISLGATRSAGKDTLAAATPAGDPPVEGGSVSSNRAQQQVHRQAHQPAHAPTVQVWLDLSRPPLAAARRLPPAQREAAGAALDEQQDAVLARVRALGGAELARVRAVRNAVAVQVPAARVPEAAVIDGVTRVRPVQHRMHVLPPADPASGPRR